MHKDPGNQFRPLLADDPPAFLDALKSPWDDVPDLEEYNHLAYQRIVRTLQEVARSKVSEGGSNTQALLVLGEAGTGKTHLLMRVARNLGKSHQILFVRQPNNEDAVAQHVWANIVESLTRSLPCSGTQRSQLDDMLAHVFTAVLVPEFEQDIQAGKDAERKQRWVKKLRSDPFNFFSMLGKGDKLQQNMNYIRNRTLRFLQVAHPGVDQKIARVLITYCFVQQEYRKRLLLTWLSGQDVDEEEANTLGLPASWVTIDETSSEASTRQQREEQALRAIRTIGILSTHYQPLILAFDELEGLKDQKRLTQRWGNTVRDIFTMTPNLLIVTCIFPSAWSDWFKKELDQSAAERIAQQIVTLDTFGPQHGLKLLASRLAHAFTKHRLPTNIYPFTDDDVAKLCSEATSPRTFLQAARALFQSWLDGDVRVREPGPVPVVSRQTIDTLLRSTVISYVSDHQDTYKSVIPIEQDFFGRIKSITESLLKYADEKVSFGAATCGSKVMPPNFIIKPAQGEEPLCIAALSSEGTGFAARMKNLNTELRSGREFKHAVVVRDARCHKVNGKVGQESVEEFKQLGGVFLTLSKEGCCVLNAIYDTLVAIEEHDLAIGTHQIDKRQFVEYLRAEGTFQRTQLFPVAASRSSCIARAIGNATQPPKPPVPPVTPPKAKDGVQTPRYRPKYVSGHWSVTRYQAVTGKPMSDRKVFPTREEAQAYVDQFPYPPFPLTIERLP